VDRYKREGQHLTAELNGELVILHQLTGIYYGMNEVASRTWSLLERPVTLDELAASIAGEFAVSPEVAGRDIEILVAALCAAGLVERLD
jgi:hypothetical protein